MKRLLSAITAVFAAVILSGFCVLASTDVYIDGTKVLYTEDTGYPFTENGSILLPLYPTFEAFGCDSVIQDNPNGTVVITCGDISVSINTSGNSICRNGTEIPSVYGLVWRGGPLYVPAKIFAAFDAEVFFGGSGVIITRPREENAQIEIFAASYDKSYRGSKYFGAKYEPENGIYPGDASGEETAQAVSRFTEVFHKSPAAFTVSDGTEGAEKALVFAADSGRTVRYVYCIDGFDAEKVTELAKKLEASGAKILLCPVSGNDCVHSESFRDAGEGYTENFRRTADIFRSCAPSVAMVWQICSCRYESCQLLYPGDRYTDYVELSMCSGEVSDTKALSYISAVYGYKKPLILNIDIGVGEYRRDFLNFCTYLPVKYPTVKYLFIGGIPENITDREYLNILRTAFSGNSYTEKSGTVQSGMPYFFELGNNVTVPPSEIKVYSHIHGDDAEVSHVVYSLGGKQTEKGGIGDMPYEAAIDFSGYSGKTVSLRAVAYDINGTALADRTYTVNVSTRQSADMKTANTDSTSPAVYIVIILVSICAIVLTVKKINDIFM